MVKFRDLNSVSNSCAVEIICSFRASCYSYIFSCKFILFCVDMFILFMICSHVLHNFLSVASSSDDSHALEYLSFLVWLFIFLCIFLGLLDRNMFIQPYKYGEFYGYIWSLKTTIAHLKTVPNINAYLWTRTLHHSRCPSQLDSIPRAIRTNTS